MRAGTLNYIGHFQTDKPRQTHFPPFSRPGLPLALYKLSLHKKHALWVGAHHLAHTPGLPPLPTRRGMSPLVCQDDQYSESDFGAWLSPPRYESDLQLYAGSDRLL